MPAILKQVKDAIRNPVAYGGYTRRIYCASGEIVCAACARKEYREIVDSLFNGHKWSLYPIGVDAYWEGPALQCGVCQEDIASEYGDPNAPEGAA